MPIRSVLPTVLLLALAGACSDDASKPDASLDLALADSAPIIPDVRVDADPSSAPVIERIIPADGFANGTTPVVLIGKNFEHGARVFLDGGGADIIQSVTVSSPVSLAFTMPRNPYGAPNYDMPQRV